MTVKLFEALRFFQRWNKALLLWLFFLYCWWVAPYGIVNSKLQSTLPVAFNVRIYPWRFLTLSGRGEKVDMCHGCNSWKTSLQARTCLTPNSVFITSLEDVQLKNIFQKTTLRTLLITGNGNLTLLSLLPKLATLSKILHNRQMETPPSQRNPPTPALSKGS